MPKTVLIVDDSATIRQVVGMTLKGAGYEVMEACDGKDALRKLDGKKINLIISDVNMPNMDGISFVKEAKKLANYKFTPVIMLTTPGWSSRSSQTRCWRPSPSSSCPEPGGDHAAAHRDG